MRLLTTTAMAVVILVTGSGRLAAVEPSIDEPVTLENVVAPAANRADEPLAAGFSAAAARHFLDTSAVAWQKHFKCMTCHTNYLYLMARPSCGAPDDAQRTVRQFAEDLVAQRWEKEGPRWDAEVVMTALVLAANDAQTTGRLHPLTRRALDRVWKVQHEDGGFEWLKCDWPPMESDDEFGATMAALAVSVAPENYAETPAAQQGIARLHSYLEKSPLPTLHHRVMLVWADTYRAGWLAAEERQRVIDELLALQHDDGSWSIATLGNWRREDGSPQDVTSGDGYATGLAVYLARRTGLPADDQRLQRGVAWLKANQRQSGRWFTRSLHKDGRHFISHAGTSLAVMALAACGEFQ